MFRNRLALGLIIILLGVGFFLSKMGVFALELRLWWPAILVIIGIAGLFSRRSILWNACLVFLGGFLLLNYHNIIPGNAWNYFWPAALILVGVLIIFGNDRVRVRIHERNSEQNPGQNSSKGQDANDFPDYVVLLGGLDVRNNSQNFKGGRASAVFGGMEVDFSQARMQAEEVNFSASAAFGGIEITVPKDWQVIVTGTPILGGIENRCQSPQQEGSPRFRLNASAICGAVEIKN